MNTQRPWYKRGVVWFLIGAVAFIVYTTGTTDSLSSAQVQSQSVQVVNVVNVAPVAVPAYEQKVAQPAVQPTANLSNDNYYTNVDGNTVHSPAYSADDSVPAGASARCRDGSYSFSQHRSGTCSHHGGVAEWL